MAALDAAAYPILSSSHRSSFPRFPICLKSSPSIRLFYKSISSNPYLLLKSHPCPLLSINNPTRKSAKSFKVCSSAVEEEIAVAEEKPEQEETQQPPNPRRKLFVLNLPWSLKVEDIKNIFGECGTVADVEIIKQKDGKSRGFAFVTMASGEEAQAVIDKFDSHELLGRIIRVEYAKKFKRTSPPPPASPPAGETHHKVYVSNLAWKVRSSHLREIFSPDFNPVSVRVVFDSPSGRTSGYGFASFATKEEAESAISALNGKELFNRPLRLKFSEKKIEEPKDGKEEEDTSEEPQQS